MSWLMYPVSTTTIFDCTNFSLFYIRGGKYSYNIHYSDFYFRKLLCNVV